MTRIAVVVGLISVALSIPLASRAADPQPVLQIDFDAPSVAADKLLAHENLHIGTGVGGSRGLRASYTPIESGSSRLVVRLPLPPALEYTLNYDVYFEDDFQFTRGGKLHGLGPSRPVTGGRPIRTDGWSSRVVFRREGGAASYNYHQRQRGKYGEGGDRRNSEFRFEKARWHSVALHVRLNEKADAATGLARVYVDGDLIDSRQDVQWRGQANDETLITQLLFSTFHGGSNSSWTPKDEQGNPVTVHAQFDNFEVYPGEFIRGKRADEADRR